MAWPIVSRAEEWRRVSPIGLTLHGLTVLPHMQTVGNAGRNRRNELRPCSPSGERTPRSPAVPQPISSPVFGEWPAQSRSDGMCRKYVSAQIRAGVRQGPHRILVTRSGQLLPSDDGRTRCRPHAPDQPMRHNHYPGGTHSAGNCGPGKDAERQGW